MKRIITCSDGTWNKPNVTEKGNWEHTNILWIQQSIGQFAATNHIPAEQLEQTLENCRNRLMQSRSKRIRPLLDDKILLGWNALMNTAYSKAFAALGDTSYKEMAIQNMAFIESKFISNFFIKWNYRQRKNRSVFTSDSSGCEARISSISVSS